jgi:hypothetical protein
MPTIGFQSFLDHSYWSISNGTLTSTTSTGFSMTTNPSNTVTYTLNNNPPTSGILYSGVMTFNYNSLFGENIVGRIYINGSPTILSFSNTINIPAGSTVYFSAQNNDPIVAGLTISNFQFEYNDEIPCFNEGSKILCFKDNEEEYIPIQNIKKGDLVKTYKHGFQRVEIIGKKKMCNLNSSKKEDRMYRLSKENYPELFEDLYTTGYHSILVNNLTDEQIEKTREIVSMLFKTDDKYRLIASLDPKAEEITEEGEYTIYHFALEHEDIFMNYGVYANGLLVESNSIRNMKEYSGMEYF